MLKEKGREERKKNKVRGGKGEKKELRVGKQMKSQLDFGIVDTLALKV
jgi:hypothetical protein